MQSQPKVCITTLEFPPDVGGVGESVARIARMIQDLGYEVHVAVFRAKQMNTAGEHQRAGSKTTEVNGIFVHRLYTASRSQTPMIQDFYSEIFFLLKQLHRQYHFDLLHGFFLNETGFITTLLGQELEIPVINSIRGSDLHRHIFCPKQLSPMSWVLEHSNWITAVSNDLLRRARVLVPGIEHKSNAFWNSIVPIDFSQLTPPTFTDPLQGTVIGSLGRFREKKGLEYLLDACGKLAATNIDFTLLLVGDFEPREGEYWLAEMERCGIQDRVRITGMMDRMQALAHLALIDIFAVPSLHDGCPNAMLEAMLAGKAIIGTSIDAIGEILSQGDSGLVVAPAASDELETALRTLIEQPLLRHRLGITARKMALQELSPAVEQDNWHKVYQKVLSSHRIPKPLSAMALQ